jgi:outer membrane biogenesis lipoprotein LolB
MGDTDMKRLSTVLLAIMLLFLTACAGSTEPQQTDEASSKTAETDGQIQDGSETQ